MSVNNKKLPHKRYQYGQDALVKAIEMVRSGESIGKAALATNVPKSTLAEKLKQNCSGNEKNCVGQLPILKVYFHFIIAEIKKGGPKPFLSAKSEQELEAWIHENGRLGHPKDGISIREGAWILSEEKQNKPFKAGAPSKGWLQKFRGRYPSFSLHKCEPLSAAAWAIEPKNIISWFMQVVEICRQEGVEDILLDPRRLLNGDESGFELTPSGYAYVKTGTKALKVTFNGKAQVTVLFCFSAAGVTLKPHILFDGKRQTDRLKDSIPGNITFDMTDSGWQTSASFMRWLRDCLVVQLKELGIPFPVILFIDGHSSHDTLEVRKAAKSLGIILIKLYPNCTQDLQPADKCLFRPIKAFYKQVIASNQMRDPNFVASRFTIGGIISKILCMIDPELVKKSFEVTGLYPFDQDKARATMSSRTTETPVDLEVAGPSLEAQETVTIQAHVSTSQSVASFSPGLEANGDGDNCVDYSPIWNETMEVNLAIKSIGFDDNNSPLLLSSSNPVNNTIYHDPNIQIENDEPSRSTSYLEGEGKIDALLLNTNPNDGSGISLEVPQLSNYKLQTRKLAFQTSYEKFCKIVGKK